jgi:hypothetical protein
MQRSQVQRCVGIAVDSKQVGSVLCQLAHAAQVAGLAEAGDSKVEYIYSTFKVTRVHPQQAKQPCRE